MDLREIRTVCMAVVREAGSVAIISVAILLLGCSQSSDIQLEGPTKPVPPSSSNDTGNPPDSAPKNPNDPATPTIPTSSARPTSYRIFCHDRYPPYMTTISSLASPLGFGAGIETVEVMSDGSTRNLEAIESPQVLSLPQFGNARVLFSARRSATNRARYLYIADVDVVTRTGRAKFLGSESPVSGGTSLAASRAKFSARSFGVSDKGRYLLLGQVGGYKVVEAATLREVGILNVGWAGLYVNPSLRESDMTLSVSFASRGGFESRVYSLKIAGGQLQVKDLVSQVSGLRRPLVSIGSSAGEGFAALDENNRIVVISPANKSQPLSIVKLSNLPKTGQLASAAAFWRDTSSTAGGRGELRAVVAFENVVPHLRRSSDRYKIEQVFARVLNIDESSLTATSTESDFEYPADAVKSMAAGTMASEIPGLSEFTATPDGRAVFASLPGGVSRQIYRLTTNGFERVSQEECTGMSIGVEP